MSPVTEKWSMKSRLWIRLFNLCLLMGPTASECQTRQARVHLIFSRMSEWVSEWLGPTLLPVLSAMLSSQSLAQSSETVAASDDVMSVIVVVIHQHLKVVTWPTTHTSHTSVVSWQFWCCLWHLLCHELSCQSQGKPAGHYHNNSLSQLRSFVIIVTCLQPSNTLQVYMLISLVLLAFTI